MPLNFFSSPKKSKSKRRSGRKTLKDKRCDKLTNSDCLARPDNCRWASGKKRSFCTRKRYRYVP